MTMKRRQFIRKAALGAAATTSLAATGCAPESTSRGSVGSNRPKIRWRLASSFPEILDTIYGAGMMLAERVSQITDGNFSIRVYATGELVPGLQVLDAVQQGTVQIGHTSGYYYIGKNPALVFDTSVPFGLTARQQLAWIYHGGGLEFMREVYADFNIINFVGGSTGAQMGGWFRRQIHTLQDLQGLKMRIPGLGGEVMNRLGVSVQNIAGGEIYQALEQGAIDATEWVGPYDDLKLGFHKVAPNYYYPGWWEPGPMLSFLVNRDAWDALPAEYQGALETATAEASLSMLNRYDAQNPAAFQEILAQDVNVLPFSDDIMKAAYKEFTDVVETAAAGDAMYGKIYEAWKKFRNESAAWFGTAEHAYLSFASKQIKG